MRYTALLLVASVLVAGCTGTVPGSSPTESPPSPTPHAEPVEYVVRGGDLPDELASVTVTLQVVLVERSADLGPCYPGAFTGPYKPSLTQLSTPQGECHRGERVSVTLSGGDDSRSLGGFTAPGRASGHALLLTDVTATHRNGTTVTSFHGAGGDVLRSTPNRTSGRFGLELGVEATDDGFSYDYWLSQGAFDPAG